MRWVITATRAPAAAKAVAIPTPTFRCERICGRCMILGTGIANRTPGGEIYGIFSRPLLVQVCE
jgi:hypothetical protein